MAEEDQDQKTEYPTGKRLGEARARGQLPVSREVSTWVLFLGIFIVIKWLAVPMAESMITHLRVFLERPDQMNLDGRGLQTILLNILVPLAFSTVAIFLVLAVAAVTGYLAQNGLFMSLDLITPSFGKLNPANGFKRLFSVIALVELGKSFFKMIIIGTAVFFVLMPIIDDAPAFSLRPLMDIMAYMHDKALRLIIILLLIYAFIAVADLFYQRYSYIKSLRMTKAEVKDEFKQQEGDPQIKQRLRQIRVDKARKRMMAQVPKADVIITNPTHYAVALQYDNKKMTAPLVLAKGVNLIAERIRELGEEHRIPLVSNPPLARALYDTVEVDREIPTQHYRAVAEVISYVYKLRNRKL